MDLWTMVVLVTLIAVSAGVFSDYMKTQRVKAKNEPSATDSDLHAEVEALRERVAVLEKIVTDERFHLEREINQLERTG